MRNPFTPGNGIMPPYLAGRDKDIRDFDKILTQALILPRNIVIYGLRGTGKTVLLHQFKEIAKSKNWLVIEREFNEKHADEQEFADAITRDIQTKIFALSSIRKFKTIGKDFAKSVAQSKISYKDYSYQFLFEKKKEPLEDYLVKLLENGWKTFNRAKKKGVVFLLDEFHNVKDKKIYRNYPLASFLTAISHVQRKGMRYFIVLSGLPSLTNNLRRAKSYVERMFNFRELTNLNPEDTYDAIEKPLTKSTASFSPKLITRLGNETKGYPFFIQEYSYFTIENIEKDRLIDESDFDKIYSLLLKELDKSIFDIRYKIASAGEAKVLSAMAQAGERPSMKEIFRIYGKGYEGLRKYLQRLEKKGLIYKVKRGRYDYTVPLFREFLLRH